MNSPTFSPLYQQIKSLITRSLQSGEWKPGEAIPSEIELATRFGVSQGTVRKAVDELATENLLMRRQGKGTFVATHTEHKSQYRFLRLRPAEGELEDPESKVLEVKRGRASAEAARVLDLKTGDPVIQIRRLLIFSGVPTVLDDICLPGNLFKGLTQAAFDSHKGSMYGMFETQFGVGMVRAEERLHAASADETTAALLEVPVNTALLVVERQTFTYGDQPVEWRRGQYETSHHFYCNTLA